MSVSTSPLIAPRAWRFGNLAAYGAGLLPAAWALVLAVTDQLGAEPIKALEQMLGLWAFRFLLASLAVAPLRYLRLIDLMRVRRALGLLCFTYAALHLAVYLGLDYRFDLGAIGADIVKRPYITAGMLGFAVLVPLAVTSNDALIRRMGWRAWKRLHGFVYLALAATVVHLLLVIKTISIEPLIHAAIAAALMLNRLLRR